MNSAQRKPDIVDSQGRMVPLGSTLGSGGEGTVYEVKQAVDRAAKIYLKPLSEERASKIRAMVKMNPDGLAKLMSWPVDLLLEKRTKQPIGLLIPRVHNKKNVHHLYGPKSRLQDFPRADWRFLIRAAANIAKAFAAVHDTNCVIGDVNHGSIMVGGDATVSLIDCESFQVNAQGRQFFCEVGIETFTPPELQGVPSYRNIVRTANFDNFGLAVMVFHLLFMGRHPFAGKYSGAGEMPIWRAIKECRFPYSINHKAMQMDRPPGTPPLSFVGSELSHLFETAFSRAAIAGGRPTARDWASALKKLEANTKQCSNFAGHWHPNHLSVCPWCTMEAQGANPLFPFVVRTGQAGPTFDVDALWRQIESLPDLGPAPTIPTVQKEVLSAALKVGRPGAGAKVAPILIASAVFLGGSIALPPLFFIFAIAAVFIHGFVVKQFSNAEEISRFRNIMFEAERKSSQATTDWQNNAGPASFSAAKARFDLARTELKGVPAKRASELEKLKQSQRKLQLDHFLDKFELEDAKIDGIGPGRKRTLASYGIETAEDIVPRRINAVPGFGPKMVERLMRWRRSIEVKFVFDPTKAVDPRDIAKVEQQILALKSKAESAAKTAYAEALQAHARVLAIRQAGRRKMDELQNEVAQARADYDFVSG
jgi:DNA-binding helix-hairpin-helix protein with protein kinase domain